MAWSSPGLLPPALGPLVAAHAHGAVVRLGDLQQGGEDRVRGHDDEGHDPGGGDHLVGVQARLPCPRLERVADGVVPLDRYGDQAEGGDADGDACGAIKTNVRGAPSSWGYVLSFDILVKCCVYRKSAQIGGTF